MILEFMRITPLVKHPDGSWVRATYGFFCAKGNAGPYLSMRSERWESRNGRPFGREPAETGRTIGRHTLEAPDLAFLAPLLPFAMFEPESGPVHYEANALFWLDLIKNPAKARTDDRPVEAFLQHVCWGTLPDDVDALAAGRLLAATLANLCGEDHEQRRGIQKQWLRQRLPALKQRFVEVVKQVDLEEQLNEARKWFRDSATKEASE